MEKYQKNPKERMAFAVGLICIVLAVYFSFYKTKKNKDEFAYPESETEKEYQLPTVSPKEAQALAKKNEPAIFLDIRNEADFNDEHVLDSINITPEKLLNGAETGKLEKGKGSVAVIIADPKELEKNSEVIDFLKNQGYSDAFVLEGGIGKWKDANGQTISSGDPNSFINQSKVAFISPEELKNFIETNYPCYILDVRQPELFKLDHIKGSINIPIQDLEGRRNDLPASIEVFVYGKNDLESFQAGVKLYDLNLLNTRVLHGGYFSWKEKNFEVVK